MAAAGSWLPASRSLAAMPTQGLVDFTGCRQGGVAEHVIGRVDRQHERHGIAQLDLFGQIFRDVQADQGLAAVQIVDHIFRPRHLVDELELFSIAVSLDDGPADDGLLFVADDQGDPFDRVLIVNDTKGQGKGQGQQEEDHRDGKAPLPEPVPFLLQDVPYFHVSHLPYTGNACPAAGHRC